MLAGLGQKLRLSPQINALFYWGILTWILSLPETPNSEWTYIPGCICMLPLRTPARPLDISHVGQTDSCVADNTPIRRLLTRLRYGKKA